MGSSLPYRVLHQPLELNSLLIIGSLDSLWFKILTIIAIRLIIYFIAHILEISI